MTEDLRDRLSALADRAPVGPLDVAALSATAGRRRRRRALVAGAPVAALLLVVPLAWSATDGPTDRISQSADQEPPPAPVVPVEALQAAVDVEVVVTDGVEPALAAEVEDDAPVRLGATAALLQLRFRAVADREARFGPYPYWSTEVRSADGGAALGIAGFCGTGWGQTGERQPDPCEGASVVSSAEPGAPVSVPLELYARVGERQAAPGTYLTELALDDGHVLRIRVEVTAQPAPVTPSPAPASPPPELADSRSLQVFFSAPDSADCTDVSPVERTVPETAAVATAALQQLFAGPTAQEQAAGLSGFGPDTAGLLRSVRVEGGTAYVDLDASLLPAIGNYSTSCGSTAFFSMVGSTLTQFPTVTDYVLAFDGDPRAFVEFMQGACQAPLEPGGPCDPAPFRPEG